MTIRNSNNYKELLSQFGNYMQSKGLSRLLLIAGLYTLYQSLFKAGAEGMLVYGMFPLAVFSMVLFLINPRQSYYVLFGIQFLLLIASSITDVKLGIATLLLAIGIIAFQIAYAIYQKADWSILRNGMIYIFLVWGVFCLFELTNSNHVQAAWNISITHYLVYPIVCAILVPIAVRDIKGIQWLLIIWSLFVIYATMKGYWQKNHGFNSRELYFLYVLGGAKTHLIWSGVRYFSCFSDAANYGVHMAMAFTTFGLAAFFTRPIRLKIYFVCIALAALYSMGISGTRAAMAVPIGGLGLFILLSRNHKMTLMGVIALLSLFVFFRFTTIAEGNQYVRKMRSAFNPTEDASYQLRVYNREQMKLLMEHKPIGYGQGLSKGERFMPKEQMPYPPDSWLVAVWVENGIIGFSIYLLTHIVLFGWCTWILLFKVRNRRLRGLLAAWLCMAAGFYVSAYANDVMQYPNSIVVYTAFALCFAGQKIDQRERVEQLLEEKQQKWIETT